jgi:hypothetical protein
MILASSINYIEELQSKVRYSVVSSDSVGSHEMRYWIWDPKAATIWKTYAFMDGAECDT